jgi:hypothetical protein
MTRGRTAGVRSTAAVLARESLHTVIAAANKVNCCNISITLIEDRVPMSMSDNACSQQLLW